MPRDIPVGNGNILVSFDHGYRLREFCFPHVGEENHTKNEPFRFGVWVEGNFSWMPEGWEIQKDYLDDSLVTSVTATHQGLKLRILANDWVDFHENIYMKKMVLEDLSGRERDVRIFFGQNFYIYNNDIGDTAAFRPEAGVLLHYKGQRHFLINARANKKYGMSQFATGNKVHESQVGTWKDAEDGVLSGNPIAQGTVDSVLGLSFRLEAGGREECFYWICAGRNWEEVLALNTLVVKKSPEALLDRTLNYWKLWVHKEPLNYGLFSGKPAWLYKRSLLILRTQIDNNGAIIAANDSDVIYFNRDTYSYLWPRDGALAAYGLDLAGYPEVSQRFFNFCAKIIDPRGFFMHKYTPSGALASSWHPWLNKDKKMQLPIQEDETALVLWALWKHYELYRDIEFIKPLYRSLIKKAADFMMNYRDPKTRLPLPSYDLWEERQGILTFTTAAVYGGLKAAAHFAEAFGETELAAGYRQGALEVRKAMDQYLYLENEKRFARMIRFKDGGEREVDATLDASLYGIFAFGAYPSDDEKVQNTMRQVREKLWCRTPVGGLARYEGDPYYRASREVPGNPWFVTTLWLAQYEIAKARTREDLVPAMTIMEWVAARALPSGVLAEQVHPYTNETLSVSPLAWSHSALVIVFQEYFNKLLEIEKCTACDQSKYSKYLKTHSSPEN